MQPVHFYLFLPIVSSALIKRLQLVDWLAAYTEKRDDSCQLKSTAWFADDIVLAKYPNVTAIMLPKTESAVDLQQLLQSKPSIFIP